jgi:acyl-CoA thioesterase FadM
MAYSITKQITFDLSDPAGVLFYPKYFELAHQALESFLPSLGISYKSWFLNPELGAPIVSAQGNFTQPIFAGDEIQIECVPSKLGETSVEFTFTFLKSGVSAGTVQSTHVFLNKSSRKKQSIPDDFRNRLKAN